MPRFRVTAYDQYGLQVLGNLDGQGEFNAKIPERCTWFKSLNTRKTLNNRIEQYIIYRLSGSGGETEIARIANSNHPNWY